LDGKSPLTGPSKATNSEGILSRKLARLDLKAIGVERKPNLAHD